MITLSHWMRFAHRITASNFGRLSNPYKLTFVVTKECHSRCKHCQIWRVKPNNELTLEEIRSFAKNSPFFSWIDFTGGEPTDRPDFAEVVGVFLDNCPGLLLVHFPTNGLKPKRIERAARDILEQRPPRLVVSVSVDGPLELNDDLRGIPGGFKRAVETYKRLKDLGGLSVYIGLTLCSQNIGLLDATVEALQEQLPLFSYRDLHVNLPHLSEHYYGNTDCVSSSNEQMLEVISEYMSHRGMPKTPFEVVERMYHKRIWRYIDTKQCPQNCSALLSSCFLAEEGTVYPCSIWNKPLGNIRDTSYSLTPLLNSQTTKQLRHHLLAKNCPNCWTPCEAYPTLFANALSFCSRATVTPPLAPTP